MYGISKEKKKPYFPNVAHNFSTPAHLFLFSFSLSSIVRFLLFSLTKAAMAKVLVLTPVPLAATMNPDSDSLSGYHGYFKFSMAPLVTLRGAQIYLFTLYYSKLSQFLVSLRL